jgi:hypothetical protein
MECAMPAPFDDPIPLPKDRKLATLKDAAAYITKGPHRRRDNFFHRFPRPGGIEYFRYIFASRHRSNQPLFARGVPPGCKRPAGHSLIARPSRLAASRLFQRIHQS